MLENEWHGPFGLLYGSRLRKWGFIASVYLQAQAHEEKRGHPLPSHGQNKRERERRPIFASCLSIAHFSLSWAEYHVI
ncbi:hypothetical protein HPP92_008536 [Vanilla planifolia]|uniref:Uncharacterized protein n=1 Tax=Vanilla planifolia TaxID=51239 RepID=A0A835R666_VANPL|nr:hypothetical protein HPP92_008725 [Vanilla planifolia]KAG0486441.1 hypothetical protein HPP92_008536 [Vanilla planifolia]